jgi:hypothetical protein
VTPLAQRLIPKRRAHTEAVATVARCGTRERWLLRTGIRLLLQ